MLLMKQFGETLAIYLHFKGYFRTGMAVEALLTLEHKQEFSVHINPSYNIHYCDS